MNLLFVVFFKCTSQTFVELLDLFEILSSLKGIKLLEISLLGTYT